MPVVRRAAVPVALCLAVLAVAAPASAHAVLVRTDPSPQTTVTKSPPRVRLEFSESVEVAFGAVRLFDVNGRRVDRGKIERARGNRDVVLPSGHLTDGTYTVTWRVVSADGHPVHGGFSFYVGAPSSISAAAVPTDQGAGRAIGWGYGAVRVAWYVGLLAVMGIVVVRRFVWTPAVHALGLTEAPVAASFRRRVERALPAAWLVLTLAGLLLLVFQAASVSGLALASSARPTVLREVLRTAFGRAWAVQMAAVVVLLLPVVALVRRRRLWGLSPTVWLGLLGVDLAVVTGGLAASGHARTDAHPVVAVASLAVHLLAVGVWVGGLGALVVLAGAGWRAVPADARAGLVRQLVPRFSRVAMIAVTAVVVTGVLNSIGNLAAVADLWHTTYGRVLTAKIALLLVAIVLAGRHLWVTPRHLADAGRGETGVRTFGVTAAVELVVLLAALGLAAGLVVLVPGRSLALASRGPVNVERQAGSYTIQVFLDPSSPGVNQLHLTFVNVQGLAAAEVTNVDARVGPLGAGESRVDMRIISPGHFVGDVRLPRPGRYRLAISTSAGGGVATHLTFRLRAGGRAGE